MIKGIIFDCFGVLTADSWHEFRVNLPAPIQSRASALNQHYCRAEITKSQFLAAVADLTGHSVSTIEQVIDNESDKNRALLSYIAKLKTDFKIGLLSNVASSWIRDQFLNPEERALFDAFIFSFEVGLTKPDPGIFQLAAERLSLQPAECLMVDDIERYCVAARGVGMKAIHYQDFKHFKTELEQLL